MKRPLAKIVLLLACVFPSSAQTNAPACAPAKETGWQSAELRGRVKTIRTYKSWFRKDERTGKTFEDKRELEEEASYDAAGKLTAWRNVNALPFEPGDGPDAVYVCDAANRLAEIKILGRDGSLLQRTTYAYDDKGREVETAEFLADGTLERREKYAVDGKGNRLETVSTEWVHPEHFSPKRFDVYVTTRQTNKYDDRGNVVEERHFKPDGSLYGTWVSSYDRAGRLIKVVRTDEQGRPEDLNTYTYGRGGLLAEELHYANFCYNRDGSMCAGTLNTEAGVFYYATKTVYEYDARGNWVSKTEYVVSERSGKKSYEPDEAAYRKIIYY